MEGKNFEQFKRGDVLTVTADSGERWIIIYGYVKGDEIYASVGYDTESDYRYAGREEEFFDRIEHLSSVEKSSAEEFNELCDFLDRENIGYYVILEDRKIIISGENMEAKKEMVNHPDHYNQGEIECIDAMIAAKGIEKVKAFCECSAFKYEWRLGHKDNSEQEVGKIKWYLDKFVELMKRKVK